MKITILLLTFGLLITSCAQKQSTISGELFIKSDSGEAQKLAAHTIYIFKRESAGKFAPNDASILDSTAQADYKTTVTDSNGQFNLNMPKGEYNVVALYRRENPQRSTVIYFWNVKVSAREDAARVSLNDQNLTDWKIEKPEKY